jgi:hypothetical protein
MAHVDRRPKAGGTTQYTTEVAAGFDLIRETEVDLDFNVLYGEFNGGIDDTNIREAASIDYSKLDLHGRIEAGDLAPDFHLPTTGFPPGGIPPGSYAPGSVDTPDLHIDAATQWVAQVGTGLTLPYSLLDTTEVVLASFTNSPASRGGLMWIFGMFSGWLGTPGPETNLYGRLRVVGGQVAISTVVGQGTGTGVFPFQISCMTLTRGTAGASGAITLTAQLSNAGGAFIGTAASIHDVQLIGFELA